MTASPGLAQDATVDVKGLEKRQL